MSRSSKLASGVAVLGMAVGSTALFAVPSNADGATALTGQCGIDGVHGGVAIGSDGNLTYTLTDTGQDRAARFAFVGNTAGGKFTFHEYVYRYAVQGESYGPQSNEIVRVGNLRNSPGDSADYPDYNSPDGHNTDTPNVTLQTMGHTYVEATNNMEIWVKAIFDVPNTPDPSCWTNAVQAK